MDALKKAEEAKRQSDAAAQAEEPSRPATDAPAAPDNAPAGLPELPDNLALLDDEFQPAGSARKEPALAAPAARQPAAPATTNTAAAGARATAQNVFQAKQPAPRNRSPLLIVTLLALVLIGGYFWWQMQPRGGLAAPAGAARTLPPPAPIAPIAATPAAPAPAASETPAPAAPAAASEASAAPPRGAVSPPLTFTPAERRSETTRSAPPRASAAAENAEKAESPIRISPARLKINPQIASAYAAFESGDLAGAQRGYQTVLNNEPRNVDALRGLAAISLLQGKGEDAEALYLRILEADPKDSAAQAGLIGLRGQLDPVQSESRLKTLLASQPDSPALNFTLGNLYARQGRWNDAQQAYFRAYAADGDNPDYQFNLAVSLDQLRQPRLALQYYQGALAASEKQPAAFDRNQAASRIGELQK